MYVTTSRKILSEKFHWEWCVTPKYTYLDTMCEFATRVDLQTDLLDFAPTKNWHDMKVKWQMKVCRFFTAHIFCSLMNDFCVNFFFFNFFLRYSCCIPDSEWYELSHDSRLWSSMCHPSTSRAARSASLDGSMFPWIQDRNDTRKTLGQSSGTGDLKLNRRRRYCKE